jgi:hypothetical protein
VTPFRAPTVLQEAGKGKDLVRLENYDDQDAAKTPDDMVAVDLSTRKLVPPQV